MVSPSVTALLLVLAVISVSVAAVVASTRTSGELATTSRSRPRAGIHQISRGVAVGRNAPLWRRVLALPALVVIWLSIGLGLAAIVGATLAGLALLFQRVLT